MMQLIGAQRSKCKINIILWGHYYVRKKKEKYLLVNNGENTTLSKTRHQVTRKYDQKPFITTNDGQPSA